MRLERFQQHPHSPFPPLDDVHYRRQRWSRREIALFVRGGRRSIGALGRGRQTGKLIFFRRNRDAGTCTGEGLFCGACFFLLSPHGERWFPFQRHLDQTGDFRVASAAVRLWVDRDETRGRLWTSLKNTMPTLISYTEVPPPSNR